MTTPERTRASSTSAGARLRCPEGSLTTSELRSAKAGKLAEALDSPLLIVGKLFTPEHLKGATSDEAAWQAFAATPNRRRVRVRVLAQLGREARTVPVVAPENRPRLRAGTPFRSEVRSPHSAPSCGIWFFVFRDGRLLDRFEETHTVRTYTVDAMRRILHRGRFDLAAAYGVTNLEKGFRRVRRDTFRVIALARPRNGRS